METTFISIHDLTEHAVILYSSDSVVDILGYTPDELVSRSAWDFFPLDEVPYAKNFHQSRINADKAAVLAYCRIKDKDGRWIGCECCFTVVYDVMVVCTSVYSQGPRSGMRAAEAPIVRRLFSSSPKDPRYHMLSHISAKFSHPAKWDAHEPRAALFLNRFTRTLTIMYATQGLQDVIGIPAESVRGRSFYFCIAENCLQDAVNCLENAKSNNSIAYLRFWFRDPRLEDRLDTSDDSDEEMMSDKDENSPGAPVRLQDDETSLDSSESGSSNVVRSASSMDVDEDGPKDASRNSSGDSTHPADTHEAIFGSDSEQRSPLSSATESPDKELTPTDAQRGTPLELEAVISCASDGLVVCLRRARPIIPAPVWRPGTKDPSAGIFAAPWATEPILPPLRSRADVGIRPNSDPSQPTPPIRRDSPASTQPIDGDKQSAFMKAIREQAIFAWALTGINGSLAQFGLGRPHNGSIPRDGLPIWKPAGHKAPKLDASVEMDSHFGSVYQSQPWSPLDVRPSAGMFGDPGLARKSSSARRSTENLGGKAQYP